MLGHSFGGKVALEYALRYPDSLSHLVLLDTGGDSRWAQEYAPELLAKRGFSPKTVNARTALPQRPDRAAAVPPDPVAAREGVQPLHEPPAAGE